VWPLLVAFVVYYFREEIRLLLSRIRSFAVLGVKASLEAELQQSADEAAELTGRSTAPSASELVRAGEVAALTTALDERALREQIRKLAAEYQRIRATLPSGDTRTRRMEVVMSKMRTLGRAAFYLRQDLMSSAIAGERLQAIAALQVSPDFEALNWLADRVGAEKPFVGYHALVALRMAAEDPRAATYKNSLVKAAEREGRGGRDPRRSGSASCSRRFGATRAGALI
jgi:hypothetical protein